MHIKTGFAPRHLSVWTALALLLAGTTGAEAQMAEPIFPLPGSTNEVPEQPIEIKLTEQPQIKTDSIQVQLNGTPLEGRLSIDTSDLSLGFEAVPPNYNLGNNTLTVQFETQSGIQSQFSWPFTISAAAPTAAVAEPEAAATIPLTPEFTTQEIEGDTLLLSGQTQPGAAVTLNVIATIPAASLVDLGPFSITTGAPEPRQMSSTTTADSEGMFTVEFDVTGDPEQTDYQVEAVATQGDAQEIATTTLQR